MAPRILIAEGNDRAAAALEGLLRRHGLAVERSRDGVETLSRIVAAPPDLLLLDLDLQRPAGLELLDKLRRSPRTRTLPVVAFGAADGAVLARLKVSGHLEKPLRTEALLALLRRSLTKGDAAGIDRHLCRAFSGRFSGRLTLHGEREHGLLFLNGLPVSLRPGFRHDDFGDYLQRRGIISAAEYDYFRGEGEHRHEVLVQMGCLDYPELLQEKLGYLTSELVAAFALPPLAAETVPFTPPAGLQLVTVNLPRLLHQGYREHPRPAAGEGLLTRHGHHYPAPTANYFRLVNFLALSAGEREGLARLDGSRPLAKLLAGDEELAPLLLTLLALGMIRCSDEPAVPAQPDFPLRALFNAAAEESAPAEPPLESFADLVEEAAPTLELPARREDGTDASLAERVRRAHAELQGKDHYQVFALTPATFSFDLLRERYFALTREYGPELLMQLTGEEAVLVEELLATVATAYNTLSDVVKKERYDELLGADRIGLGHKGDDRFQAQVQFQSGKVFIGMGEWESAEQALRDASNIDPNSGDYLAHLAWTIYRNPKNAASRTMLEKARQMLNRALTLERTATGFAFKGWMLLDGGQDSLAEGEFNKALKLDARQALARQGLRAIEEKREAERKGLFRRMFR